MNWQAYQESLLTCAREQGCDQAEVVLTEASSLGVTVSEGQIENLEASKTARCSLRIAYQNRPGYASTEVKEDPALLVAQAIDNASGQVPDPALDFAGPQTYETLPQPHNPLEGLSLKALIEQAYGLEKAGLARDPRIEKSAGISLQVNQRTLSILNTSGLSAHHQVSRGSTVCGFIAKEGETRRDQWEQVSGTQADDFETCVNRCVDRALIRLSGHSIATGQYTLALSGKVMASLLGAFFSAINAREVEKGRSPWANELGKQVAAPCVHLVDDPYYAENPLPFDGEGRPAQKTTVVEAGTLKTFLHHSETARRAGVQTTANAVRTATGRVEIGPTNLYFLPGELTEDQLLEQMGQGLYIQYIAGLHSGLNPVSGDFSVVADGFWIENGKKQDWIHQITIAANYFKLLNEVQAFSNEIHFPGGHTVGSPAALFKQVQVAGQKETPEDSV